jgi:hypothetical protein
MYTYPGKVKATIYTITMSMARAGQSNFQPDARRRDSLAVHQDLPQEVTVIPVPTLKEKAAVAAAQSAQMSALVSNLIVPSLLRNAMGLAHFFTSPPPLNPFQPIEPSPCPPNA